jgi:hypothetical protein
VRGLSTATVIDLLNALRADLRPELTVTAADRSAGIAASAVATSAIAGAIAGLDEKICPVAPELQQSRTDPRWRQVQACCEQASQHAARLADRIALLTRETLFVVTDMEPVLYQGSITWRHGVHVLAGPCDCRRCGHRGDRLRLSKLLGDCRDLKCVRRNSVTATQPAESTVLPAEQISVVLRTAISALPIPVPTEHAVRLIQNMTLFTGRTRTVVDTWSLAVEKRLSGRFLSALDGHDPMSYRDTIVSQLDQVSTELGTVQDGLRRATELVRTISADPPQAATPQ